MGKRKKGTADRVRKAKQAKASNVFKVQSNPFEVKINKQKHKILGRKTKHDRGLPGVSRSKANKKRKETLLKEYKDRHKSNSVVDERFGEGNTEMTVEEKMLQRFAMEKKRKHEKMSLFNLNDDEEQLTHFGQSLADIKDFGNETISDDEDTGVISGEYVSEAHFGGGIFTKKRDETDETEGEKPKSRKEIMDEIIMKSKRAKFEKQNAKEESNDLREKLDNTWQEVEKLLKSSTRTPKDRETAKEHVEPDAYDLAVKQMQYDKKAAPTSREKTDAEKAAEESARIRRLEEERLRRMQDEIVDHTKSVHRSADDLNYDFVPEKIHVEPIQYKDGVLVGADDSNEIGGHSREEDDWQLEPVIDDVTNKDEDKEIDSENEPDDGSNDDADDYSDIVSEDDEDPADEESLDDANDEEIDHNFQGQSNIRRDKKQKESGNARGFPETFEEFLNQMNSKHNGDGGKCVSLLRKKFQPGLAKGNKEKLQILFEYVWQLLFSLYSEDPPNIKQADGLIRHLYELCELNPPVCARYIMSNMTTSYGCCQQSNKITVPAFGTMMQFKLIKILFSTSDFIHPVAGPAMIFMCHAIHSSRPSNLRDVASCLFLCTLVYEYVCFSKRFVPECINYLCAVICMAVPKKVQQAKGVPAAASMYLNSKNSELLVLKNKDMMDPQDISKPNLVKLLTTKDPESSNTDEPRMQILSTALRLSLQFIRLYAQLPCFKEIHEPIKAACSRCLLVTPTGKKKSQNHPFAEQLREVQAEIQRLLKKRPLLAPLVHAESNKPKMLPLYDPKIEEICEPFQKSSRKKTSAAKRERERLQHKYKREMKGAMREVKKDARFLAREQLQEQIQKDEERAAKVKRLYGLLSNQEGEVKKINRKTFKLGVS